MTWWIWVLLGFALLAVEVAVSVIGIGFFGIGALVVGLLVAFGWGGPLWMQWLLFTVISVVALLLFRQPLVRKIRGEHKAVEIDSMIGETAVALEEIGANQIGKAEMRGAPWNARNVSGRAIARGERCQVQRVEGLVLFVKGAEV